MVVLAKWQYIPHSDDSVLVPGDSGKEGEVTEYVLTGDLRG